VAGSFNKGVTEANAALRGRKKTIDEQNAKIESLQSDFNQMKEKWQDAEQEISNKMESIEKVKIEFEAKFKVKNADIESLKIDVNQAKTILQLAKNQLQLSAIKEQSQIEIRATLKHNLGKTNKNLATVQSIIEENNSEILSLNKLLEAEKQEQKSKEAEIVTLKVNLNKLQETEIGLRENQKTKEADIVQLKANIDTLTKDLDLAKNNMCLGGS
jgi:chromosome segregation ATPase